MPGYTILLVLYGIMAAALIITGVVLLTDLYKGGKHDRDDRVNLHELFAAGGEGGGSESMATEKTEKLICDRCGSVIRETASIYRCKWRLRVEKRSVVYFATARYENATARAYDLCKECTMALEAFVMEKGAKPGVGQPVDY